MPESLKLTWEYKCLFGFKHRFITVVDDIRIIVEQIQGHTAEWIAYDVESWEIISRSFWEYDTSYETAEAAMIGAEQWLKAK